MKAIDLRKNTTSSPKSSQQSSELPAEEKLSKEVLLSWEGRETEEMSKKWQVGIIIFLVLSFSFFLWQKNYFGLILILVIAFLIFFLPKRKGKTYFAILQRGARIGKEVFSWGNLKSFWIFEEPTEIYLKSKKSYLPSIVLPLPKNYFDRAREVLLNYLPEKETERNLFDVIARKIGF